MAPTETEIDDAVDEWRLGKGGPSLRKHLAARFGWTMKQVDRWASWGDIPADCSCGDRRRPHVNHRVSIPCWTYVGHERFDIDAQGSIVDKSG